MSTSSERPYHHGDLRETLMRLALASIESEGTEKLSLRKLARQAGVSATAPYRHFPSKRCLLAALITRGFRELEQATARGRDEAGDDPEEQLVGVGLAYVGFALDNPTAYHLMFSTVLEDFSEYAELKRAAEDSYAVVLGVLEQVLARHNPSGMSLTQAGGIAWSSVHGLSSALLFARDRVAGDPGKSALTSLAMLDKDRAAALRVMMRGITG